MRLNPITKKRIRRFVAHRRASLSFLCLFLIYFTSLFSELLCNGVPIAMKYNGRLYFPVLRFYPDNEFTGSGLNTRTDYKALERRARDEGRKCWMLWPPVRTGANDIVPADELKESLRTAVRLEPVSRVGGISVGPDLAITRIQGADSIFKGMDAPSKGAGLAVYWKLDEEVRQGLEARFENRDAPACNVLCRGEGGVPDASISMLPFASRRNPPREVRLTVRVSNSGARPYSWTFEKGALLPSGTAGTGEFLALPEDLRERTVQAVRKCEQGGEDQEGGESIDGLPYSMAVEREKVRFPFRPVRGHALGLDDAGRDVLVRLLYALRTALSFGLILVICSMTFGSATGLAQGYLGGWADLSGQRFIEIWSALPFLYIIILMGSIYGPGFWLMIFCYALFNWIGISYYMRAEMLRLRRLPFVEAAKCLGLPPSRIVFRHVLPNAMVPIITFFPFSLVGAIGSLAALDYLGFGLPPPTPSIGQLLQQAQSQRWAWWLILYPSLVLFVIMMLGVFVGEGVRDAFDPRVQGRME